MLLKFIIKNIVTKFKKKYLQYIIIFNIHCPYIIYIIFFFYILSLFYLCFIYVLSMFNICLIYV